MPTSGIVGWNARIRNSSRQLICNVNFTYVYVINVDCSVEPQTTMYKKPFHVFTRRAPVFIVRTFNVNLP